MAKHYSTRDFFRNTPNKLLARYFAGRGVLQDFDFTAMKETKIEPLFEVWLAVPEAERAKREVDLREIGDMSNPQGVKAIIDEAEFHLSEEGAHAAFVALLMGLPGHYERAMTVFLDYPAMWRGATRLYHADTLSHWRKRKNLPKKKAAVTQVGMTASVKVSPTAPAKTVSFQISHPNSCSLKYDVIGLKLRAMLETSGIEPRPPEVAAPVEAKAVATSTV